MMMRKTSLFLGAGILLGAVAVGCATPEEEAVVDAPAAAAAPDFVCDADNGGLTLPDGFCATVFADDLGVARHLAVNDNGDVYVGRQRSRRRGEDGTAAPGGVLALRDADGDGKAEVMEEVNDTAGTGMSIHQGYLYYSTTTEVYRVALGTDQLAPQGEPELLVSGFPQQGQHASKPMTFDGSGNMYVTVGGPSNACQEQMRTAGSPGQDPCPQLERHGGVWRFDDSRPGQTQESDGVRYATGIRNAMALDWNTEVDSLYLLQHGRDSLGDLFAEHFDLERSAELPAEEMFSVSEGDDFGWPYCYYDPFQGKKLLGPEYGGDGELVGRCDQVADTLLTFPAHWAPNDLLFYQAGTFGDHYDGGAFIAFHGSWNRAPFEQQGYTVVFVPFQGGNPAADFEVFASGFPQTDQVSTPGDAAHRPTGLAQGPDGSLYVSSDFRGGRIWRIRRISG